MLKFKTAESLLSDERIRQVNDMVIGSKTLKCYGWENFYLDKIKKTRQE